MSGQNLYGSALRVGVADGDQTVTASDYKKVNRIWITGASVADRQVVLPAAAGLKSFITDRENAFSVSVRMGTTTIDLAPGSMRTLETDGTANGLSDETGAPDQAGFSDETPMPDSDVGDPGTSAFAARSDHRHPKGAAWEVKSENFTAASGGKYAVNTGSSPVTADLDPDPAEGALVEFSDDFGTWGTHPLTIERSGKPIMGLPENMTAATPRARFALRYNGFDWRLDFDDVGPVTNVALSDAIPMPDSVSGSSGSIIAAARADHSHPITDVAWTIEAADFDAAAGGKYIPDCRTGTRTASLPPSPSEGQEVEFSDDYRSWGTNNFIIFRAGQTIMGLAENLIVSTSPPDGAPITHFGLRFINSDWRIF
jgi:hypothetical protein